MAKNRFLRSVIWLFWLGLFGFIAYRVLLTAPSEQGNRYLVYSRWNGYQNKIVEPGQYFISWQNLIPGNIRFLAISLNVQKPHFRKRFVLPSAEAYQLLLPRLDSGQLDAENPFAYQIAMSITYRLRPEKVLAIVRNIGSAPENGKNQNSAEHKEPESNTEVLGGIVEDIAERSRRRLNLRVNQELESLFSGPKWTIPDLQEYFRNIISEEFSELELLEVRIDEYRAPDLELYATVRQYYEGLLAQISTQSLSRLLDQQDQRVAEQLYLQNLERMGEILTKYPALIQYFSVIQGKKLPLLPDFRSTPSKTPQIPAE